MTLSLYTTLLYLALPAALARLYVRGLRTPAYRQRVAERLAREEPGPGRADVWVHAVSVGEVQAAQPVIQHLLTREPALRVLVTTATPTGAARVSESFGDRVTHRYAPFDLPSIVERFLDRVQPHLILVMETEIWPNLLAAAERRGAATILANARLSGRSAHRYGWVQPLTAETLGRFRWIAAQAESDAARFRALGAPPERVRVTGSIKFDRGLPGDLRDRAEALRRQWGQDRPVWVAASTHEGEEEPLLEAHRQIRTQRPKALLVLVPRHPERFERVANLVTRAGLSLVRRSAHSPCGPDTAVFLGDSMGELPMFLAAGDSAFIGGSLVPTGGHNPLEAAAVGVPVATGPHYFNFTAIVDLLVAAEAAAVVQNGAELARLMSRWLGDAALRAAIGDKGRRVVEKNRGALGRLIGLIEECLANPGGSAA